MTIRLKQSTASQEIPLGIFVDETDGKTAETELTIANTDIKLWKMGATTLASKNSGGATHISGGIYYTVLDATDTGTLGGLVIFVHVAGALPVRVECEVLAANVYDSLIAASDKLQVHADEITNGLITAAAIATDAIDADAIASDAVTEIQSGLATAANLATVAGYLDTEVAAILADTSELQGDLADGGRLDLLIDAIKARTDNLPTDPADDSDIDSQLAAIKTETDKIASIKTKTDSLTFTVAGEVDANVQSINDAALSGNGTSGDPWGPA